MRSEAWRSLESGTAPNGVPIELLDVRELEAMDERRATKVLLTL
ncbi:hypothetical protein ACFYO5_11065 [Streptomyces sp. NPDC006259]